MTLSLAYWCVLIAAFLPLVWSWVAKASGGKFDNRDPRGWLARQQNPRSIRANAAQQNAFEAFAPFAAGVVCSQLAGVDSQWIAALSMVFIAARLAHGLLYIGNKATLRSLAWTLGFACTVALLTLAATQMGATATR
jgi:uncharacterized MAPEG superfamily protein